MMRTPEDTPRARRGLSSDRQWGYFLTSRLDHQNQ